MNMIDTLKKNLKGNVQNINETVSSNNEIINHKFDYSDAVPTKDSISHLVKYLDNVYEQYLWLFKEDDKKIENKHNYQKKYLLCLDVRIKDQKYNNIICNSFMAFKKAVSDGNLNNIEGMEIRLNLDFKKGDIIYNNLFTIVIKPFNFKFIRQSSYNLLEMNVIENNINEILKRFPTVNSIFCTK